MQKPLPDKAFFSGDKIIINTGRDINTCRRFSIPYQCFSGGFKYRYPAPCKHRYGINFLSVRTDDKKIIDIVIVGRIGQGQIYRNVKRYQTTTYPEVLAVRVDTSLYFTNTRYLEDQILHITANRPEIKHFILIGSAINFIDSSALDTLGNLQRRLDRTGVEFHLAGMKGDVMDRLERVGFLKKIGTDHIHLTVHEAMKTLNFIN